jgi:hypothetical protein
MAKVKVKFLKSHPGFAYFAGDVGEMEAAKAAALLNKGYVITLPEESIEVIEDNPLPEDFPARDILWAEGFSSIAQVLEAGESLKAIKGIGKGMYQRIINYQQ